MFGGRSRKLSKSVLQTDERSQSQMLVKTGVNPKLLALRQCYKRNRGELKSLCNLPATVIGEETDSNDSER